MFVHPPGKLKDTVKLSDRRIGADHQPTPDQGADATQGDLEW
jgi:hypothetical protein